LTGDPVIVCLTDPVVTTISDILGSNKMQNGDILEPANPDLPGKWTRERL